MALETRNTLTGWVVRNWKPTVIQVKSWMESFWHKGDAIPISAIEGLTEFLNNLPSTGTLARLEKLIPETLLLNAGDVYTLPEGLYLDFLIVIPAQDLNGFRVGTSPGADDLVLEQEEVLAADSRSFFSIAQDAIQGERQFHFTGLQPDTKIIFYKR